MRLGYPSSQPNHRVIESSNHRTAVHSLTLTAFRNYRSLSLQTGGRSVVITGPNGSGKTNLLEAISLLAPGRGLRGAKLAQLRNQQTDLQQGWGVALEVESSGHSYQFGTGQHPGKEDKRVIRLNGENLNSQAALGQYFAILWQTPQMDTLFTGGMSDRRRLFDRLTASFQPDHSSQMARYEYLMRERNKLLMQPGMAQNSWLDSLEHKMAESSLAMAAARVETLLALQAAIETLHASFPKADIALQGFAEQGLLQSTTAALELEDQLAAALKQSRGADAQSGRSSHGAHRLECYVTHRPKATEAAYCSTGEQKVLLLALLLAQTVALRDRQHRLPILLLDEVIAHLDAERRAALFSVLEELKLQAWLTGTDAERFHGMPQETLFLESPLT